MDELTLLKDNCIVTDKGCWLWQGCKSQAGYGVTTHRTKYITVHRLSFKLAYGYLPDTVHHLKTCEGKHCGNPEHLIATTQEEHRKKYHSSNVEGWCVTGNHRYIEAPKKTVLLGVSVVTLKKTNGGCYACKLERERLRYRAKGGKVAS